MMSSSAVFAITSRHIGLLLDHSPPGISTSLPKSKSAQLAEMIRERIASGEWGNRRPPERAISEEYLVSRTTLRAALQVLDKELWLRRSFARLRGSEIVVAARSHPKDSGTGYVLLLTPSLPGNPLLLEHIAVVRGMLAKAFIDVEIKEAAHHAVVKDRAPTDPNQQTAASSAIPQGGETNLSTAIVRRKGNWNGKGTGIA